MKDLPRLPAHALGLDESRLVALIQDCKAHGQDLHSLLVCRGGTIALEAGWWPYQGRRQVMHSIAKSFTSAAIGFALAEGLLSLTDAVVGFFPQHLPREISANLKAMTVEDLLTMRAGHAEEISGAVWRQIKTSWIAEFFKVPVVHRPGTVYVYSSAASYMLSAIVTKVSGQTLQEYLKPRLFEPLGIEGESWDISVDGINPGGNGLTVAPMDLLKLGLLYAQGGVWCGRQLLSAAWIARSVSPHSRYGDAGLGYGYHWHTGPDGEFFATGLFGQLIAVFPQWDIVAVVTSATPGPMPCLGQIVPLLRRSLPGILEGGAADPGLARLLADISQPIVLESESGGAPGIRSYILQDNALAISRVTLAIDPDVCVLTMCDPQGEHTVVMGMGGWTLCETTMPGAQLHHGYALRPAKVMAGARWLRENLLEMRWLFVDTVFCDTVTCEFAAGTVTLRRSVNVNSGDLSWPQLDGVLQR